MIPSTKNTKHTGVSPEDKQTEDYILPSGSFLLIFMKNLPMMNDFKKNYVCIKLFCVYIPEAM